MSRRPEVVYRFCIALGISLFRVLGLRRRVVGADAVPATGGAVLAITHFGYLDFGLTEWLVWVWRRRLVRFLVTKAAWDHPVAGPLLKAMRHIPVDRAASGSAYQHAVIALRAGELVGVFPESQVNLSWTVGALKTGAVRMAAEAGVPLIPMMIWGSHRVITKQHLVRLSEAWRAPVTIDIGEPIHVSRDQDVAACTQRLRDTLQGMLDQAQAGYPERPPAGAWWQPAHLGGAAPIPEPAAGPNVQTRPSPTPRQVVPHAQSR